MNKLITPITNFRDQVNLSGVTLYLPNVGGVFGNGILSAISFFLTIILALMVVAWIGLSIFAGLKIISSAGEPDKIESGTKTIKNIWLGIAIGIGFFAVLSVVGTIAGIGNVFEWYTNLAQCGGGDSKFLFQERESQEVQDKFDSGSSRVFVGCCDFSASGSKKWEVADLSGTVPPGFETAATGCTVTTLIDK